MRQQQGNENEALNAHPITITRQGMTGRIANNESIPRLPNEARETDNATLPPNQMHIRPTRKAFVRPTNTVIPAHPQVEEKIALPMGIIVQPLSEEAGEVPLVDFSQVRLDPNGPPVTQVPRCRRCRGYINPYVIFTDGGRRWQCNLCRAYAEVTGQYFCPIDPQTGFRQDVQSRPELCFGTYDIVAPSEYLVRPPQKPVFLFMLDVSHNAIQSGMLQQQCDGILKAIEQMEDDDATYVSFIAFDSVIYLFNLRSSFSAPKMIVAPDLVFDTPQINDQNNLEPVELPALAEDLVVSVQDSYDLIKMLIEKLPTMFANTSNVESAFGPALNTALTLIGPTGGKIIASVGSMPSMGEGRLRARDNEKKVMGTNNEYLLCVPAIDWYKQRSICASQLQVSIDLVVNDAAAVDLASIAPLARYTSGHIYRYNATSRIGGLALDMARLLLRDTGFEAVLRLRCAANLQVANCFGHCYVQDSSLLRLPVVDSDTTYTLQFKVANAINSQNFFIQVALLYTTRNRERRIRVHTFALQVSSSIPRILNSMDCTAAANMLMKWGIDYATNASFATTQQKINDKIIAMLKATKQNTAGRFGSALVVPESLKYLPQMMVGYYRQAAIRNSTLFDTMPDERVASQGLFMVLPPTPALTYCVPAVYCGYAQRLHSQDNLPVLEQCAQDSLRPDGIYLISLGTSLIIWYGKGVDARILDEYKLISNDDNVIAGDSTLSGDENIAEAAARFEDLVRSQQLATQAGVHTAPRIVPQGDTIEKWVMAQLSEEDAKEAVGLGAYLSLLHRKVSLE